LDSEGNLGNEELARPCGAPRIHRVGVAQGLQQASESSVLERRHARSPGTPVPVACHRQRVHVMADPSPVRSRLNLVRASPPRYGTTRGLRLCLAPATACGNGRCGRRYKDFSSTVEQAAAEDHSMLTEVRDDEHSKLKRHRSSSHAPRARQAANRPRARPERCRAGPPRLHLRVRSGSGVVPRQSLPAVRRQSALLTCAAHGG
jgi:hypothetical protein